MEMSLKEILQIRKEHIRNELKKIEVTEFNLLVMKENFQEEEKHIIALINCNEEFKQQENALEFIYKDLMNKGEKIVRRKEHKTRHIVIKKAKGELAGKVDTQIIKYLNDFYELKVEDILKKLLEDKIFSVNDSANLSGYVRNRLSMMKKKKLIKSQSHGMVTLC